MEIDFAIVYFGLTRSIKTTYISHQQKIYDVLDKNNLSYKKFMHTWSTRDNKQNAWNIILPHEIDYNEHKLLNLDYYKIDDEDEFIETRDMSLYNEIDGVEYTKWPPFLLSNYVCCLESIMRSFKLVEEVVNKGDRFKYVLFIRPDIEILNEIPLKEILYNNINFPDSNRFHNGYSCAYVILNYENACIYGKNITKLEEYRKNYGEIISEKHVKDFAIINNISINEISMKYEIIHTLE
jgi:hypothetical protein